MLGPRRRAARAWRTGGAAREADVRGHASPGTERNCGRGAPQLGVRRADGHFRGALGNALCTHRRSADRGRDVGRGRPLQRHAGPPQPRAQGQDSARDGRRNGRDQGCGRVACSEPRSDSHRAVTPERHPFEEYTVSQLDSTHEHLIATYRKKAKHYNIVSQLYPVPGYPQRAQRRRAIEALGLRPGDTVVDVACAPGQNFPLIERTIGPEGRIVGVDLTDAMLAQAQRRTESNGWTNISLVQADAADFAFPTEVDAILSTYALSHVPERGEVISHGASALSRGGRWVVLDLKAPDNAPRWLTQLGIALGRP